MKKSKSKKIIVFISVSILSSLLFFLLYSEEENQKKKWDAISHDKTNFPLIGKHRTVPCGDCHLKGVLQGTPTDCEACHWIRKKDDRYNLKLGLHCGDCHTPHDWKIIQPGAWNHEQNTGFPLQGTHKILDCVQCHGNKIFSGLPDDCFSCHQQDYQNATDPDHLAAQFSTDCSLCHTSFDWDQTNFEHSDFPLKGSHLTASCSSCHKNGIYSGTPSQCVACHLEDYNQAKDPDHKEAGFSTSCEVCHGFEAVSWQGAVFNHNQIWPLQGAHSTLDCTQCHSSGYNLPRDCYGCHQADYQTTTNPNHISAGFPTQCEYCHYPTHISWTQGIFNHNFPITSGEHAGFSCQECHLTSNYSIFSCIDCHYHNKSKMDGIHHKVSGYVYNSQACYACHPQGTE